MSAQGILIALFVIPSVYALLLAVILVHEAGHLIAGLLLGMRLIRIRVGPFEYRRPEGFSPRLQWNGALTGAIFLRAGRRAMRATVLRQAVVSLAGATANGCSAVLIAWLSQRGTMSAIAGNAFALLSICLAFGNLFPWRTRGFENDGYKFCSLLFSRRAREEAVVRLTLLERLHEFRQFYAAGSFAEASKSLDGILLAFDRLPELSKQVEAKSRFDNLRMLIDRAAVGTVENNLADHTLPITMPDLDASSPVS